MKNSIKMLKIYFLIIIVLEIGLFFNFLITPVQAITKPQLQINIPTISLSESACQAGEDCSIPWIGEYIGGIYKYAINIVGILAAVVLMFGGAVWLTAGGNASRVTEAKAWIGASLTGLVLVLCSYMIMNIINPNLIKLGSLNISGVSFKSQEEKTDYSCKWAQATYGDFTDAGNFAILEYPKCVGNDIESDKNRCSQKEAHDENSICCCPKAGGTWAYQNGIDQQIGDESMALKFLLNCMREKLPIGVGQISSISDSHVIGNLLECDKPGCDKAICQHSCQSCHYGGGMGINKSLAVDFGDQNNATIIIGAAHECGSDYAILEDNNTPNAHIHVSAKACPKN